MTGSTGTYTIRTTTSADVTHDEDTSVGADTITSPEPEMVVEAVTVTVQPGDTLIFIGYIVGIDWMEIAALNGISGPDYIISPGQVLTLP